MSTSSRDGSAARDDAPTGARRAPVGPRVLGGVIFAIGVFLLVEAFQELGDDELTPTGPRFAPVVISLMWVVFSGLYFARQLFRPGVDYPDPGAVEAGAVDSDASKSTVDDGDDSTVDYVDHAARAETVSWRQPALLTVMLVAYAVALDPVGFVISSALFFFGAAWVLGSKNLLREAIIAVILAVVVYFGMTAGLDVSLPSGVLPI
ncbi:tripartite tricarboxylate transporter TctB family protein [Stackebrandtia soli]|uniref:tripartite tricarboxylate transporter TctB family protein n=1 Tax=Stackebrandtia soli TaxID=1892856 RepID=UPI0039EBA77F